MDLDAPPDGALAQGRKLTWLFHLVLHAPEEVLHIENVEVDFTRKGELMWRQTYPRSYLEHLTWLEGGIRYDTGYFLENIQFSDNQMVSTERIADPDIPAGGTVTWARFEEARPYFERIDAITFRFDLRNDDNEERVARHTVPIEEWDQKVELRLPFDGVWVAKRERPRHGHRRTGLNGLTTYG